MRKVIFYFLFAVCCLLITSQAFSHEYSWPDSNDTFDTTIKVPLYGGSTLNLDLGADYIRNHETVKMQMEIESNFYFKIDGLKQKSFEGFHPKVSVNGAVFFGNYRIRVSDRPGRQKVAVDINSKYLKAGMNTLKFVTGMDNQVKYSCGGANNCTSYFIHRIWLDDVDK
jgi:hypothetical protein